MGPSERSHGAEIFFTVFDHVVSLMPIDVDTFTMPDWLEPKMMQPAKCSAQRYPPLKVWWKLRRRQKIFIHPLAEGRGSHVWLSFGECVLSNPLGCILVQFLVAVNGHSFVLSFLSLLEHPLVFVELLSQFANSLFAVTNDRACFTRCIEDTHPLSCSEALCQNC